MTPGLWHRLTRGYRRLWRGAEWDAVASADWVENIMSWPATDRFHAKQGRSIGRVILEREGRRLVVYLKRHYQLSRFLGGLATLWPRGDWSPGAREFRHLEWAREQGFPVPRVVAMGEAIGPWGRLQSFLAVEELTGMLPLHEAIPQAARELSPSAFTDWKSTLIQEMARITRELHRRYYFHKDLYLCHFYIAAADCHRVPTSWAGRVFLIDLHRLSYHRWLAPWYRVKDLAQLCYSSEMPEINEVDRNVFWRQYHASHSGGPWLARAVQWKANRYRRHNQGSS